MTTPRLRRRLTIGATVAALLGAFGWLLYGGIGENIVYFLTPAELLAKGTDAMDTPVRLGGMIAENSVQWDADKLDLRFRVTDGDREIAVRSTGAPPSMFRPGIGVIVEGRFGRDSVFAATNLMVRHSNEYHPPKPGEDPKSRYKALMREGS